MLRVIESDKDLFKDAKPVDAINYPDLNEVHLNASRWKNNLNSFQKERLVLHEIFGLMRKDDSSYQLSDAFLETLNRTTFLVFNLLQIQGPAAIELLKKVDWSGITPSPNRTDRILLTIPSSDLASVLLACSFDGNLDRTKPVSGYLDESSVVGDPVCFFGVRGVLANRQAYIEISEGREELWTRICPKGEENFDFGNIRGYKNAMGKHQLRFHIYDI